MLPLDKTHSMERQIDDRTFGSSENDVYIQYLSCHGQFPKLYTNYTFQTEIHSKQTYGNTRGFFFLQFLKVENIVLSIIFIKNILLFLFAVAIPCEEKSTYTD